MENDRRTFNGRATLETGIYVTLDYLNGPDPNTMVFLFFNVLLTQIAKDIFVHVVERFFP